MNVQQFSETHGLSQFEVFTEAWKLVYGKPCGSNRVNQDYDHYVYHHTTPAYVENYMTAYQKAHRN
jgi:hypothetical protein